MRFDPSTPFSFPLPGFGFHGSHTFAVELQDGGVVATMAIRKEFPEARIIVLTTFDTDEDIYRAMQSGAKSFLLKDTPEGELAATIRAVHAGPHPLPPKLAKRLADRQKRADRSNREVDVLQLLIKGRSNKEIGSSSFGSEATVKAHLKTMFTKLKVQDRTAAAISAIRQGIVHLELSRANPLKNILRVGKNIKCGRQEGRACFALVCWARCGI